MGFSTVSTHIILLIAVLTIVGGLITTFNAYIGETRGAMHDKQKAIVSQLRTDIEVINVDASVADDNVSVYVKNVGDEKLATDCLDVFIDGDWVKFNSTTDVVDPDTDTPIDVWMPEETIRIDGNVTIDADEIYVAKVVTCNSISDTLQFST